MGSLGRLGRLDAPFLGVHVPSSDPPISPAGKVYVNKSQDLETEKTRRDPHVLPRLQLKMKSHTPSFGIHGQARASISEICVVNSYVSYSDLPFQGRTQTIVCAIHAQTPKQRRVLSFIFWGHSTSSFPPSLEEEAEVPRG